MLSRQMHSAIKLARNFTCLGNSRVTVSAGKSVVQANNEDVDLRGIHLQGKYEDLPTMIFFPQMLDQAENWIKFFKNPNNKVLDSRNVWLLYPRNFGSSDRHASYYGEDMANDVARFMWKNQISTATIGGHGIGAKHALTAACYHSSRFTGYMGVDYAPVNYQYYESFREVKTYLNAVKDIKLLGSKANLNKQLEDLIPDAKWCEVFKQNLVMEKPGVYSWNFDLASLLDNVNSARMSNIGAWNPHYGMWSGRNQFYFSDQSRWVHMGTNTLAMQKTCIKNRGFGQDIWAFQSDESPANHWMYEHSELSDLLAMRMGDFVNNLDGVNVLLSDRSSLFNEEIADRTKTRVDPEHFYQNHTPAHPHHNWRYRQDA